MHCVAPKTLAKGSRVCQSNEKFQKIKGTQINKPKNRKSWLNKKILTNNVNNSVADEVKIDGCAQTTELCRI